jgi:hypothetical protein
MTIPRRRLSGRDAFPAEDPLMPGVTRACAESCVQERNRTDCAPQWKMPGPRGPGILTGNVN